ncbi:D-methionine transport system substrate-binding protein [Salirhabdus euzebyi]|uniref:Lipoprotein n=1 Tax=Salirhabdus euzebyi TaxID=394506 RepID=A0A841Q530_9BACI|nr:MetQ/NlpA family ABC transporter substrate-binding protein [Salirhabdus euzebyi]MBB6453463.1 D-methionine transport system substrate-binding protein [Salirhabdus euzebyi]
MKKILTLLFTALFIFALAACGTAEEDTQKDTDTNAGEAQDNEAAEENTEATTIVVGSTAVPHSEVLEKAKPILAEQGIELQIEVYQDYILPNQDLNEDRLDANYFQHTPYLNQQVADFGYDFVSLGGVHIEPIGIYSKNITSVDEIPDGTAVLLSNSEPDHGRILALFEREGLITIADGVEPTEALLDDIVENPKNLEFDPSYDPGFLPEYYNREEDTLVAINTNYAIEAGLLPTEDALILEGPESPYANLLVTKTGNENNEALLALLEVLRSEEIQTFMEEEYSGAIVPVNE